MSPFNARLAATTTVNEDEDKNAVDGQHVDVVELSRPNASTARRPRRRREDDAAGRNGSRSCGRRQGEREAAKAERQAARDAKKAEREAAREAKKAAREAAKAERRDRGGAAGYREHRDGTGDGCTRVRQRHRGRFRSGGGLTARWRPMARTAVIPRRANHGHVCNLAASAESKPRRLRRPASGT